MATLFEEIVSDEMDTNEAKADQLVAQIVSRYEEPTSFSDMQETEVSDLYKFMAHFS